MTFDCFCCRFKQTKLIKLVSLPVVILQTANRRRHKCALNIVVVSAEACADHVTVLIVRRKTIAIVVKGYEVREISKVWQLHSMQPIVFSLASLWPEHCSFASRKTRFQCFITILLKLS